MKNNIGLFAALPLLVFAVLGCTFMNPFSGGQEGSGQGNGSYSDRAVDTAVGNSNVGIPECDEVLNAITAELNNPDDDVFTKAIKATVLNRIKDGIRESLANNTEKDRAEMVKTCREFKAQFEKYKAEQAAPSNSR